MKQCKWFYVPNSGKLKVDFTELGKLLNNLPELVKKRNTKKCNENYLLKLQKQIHIAEITFERTKNKLTKVYWEGRLDTLVECYDMLIEEIKD